MKEKSKSGKSFVDAAGVTPVPPAGKPDKTNLPPMSSRIHLARRSPSGRPQGPLRLVAQHLGGSGTVILECGHRIYRDTTHDKRRRCPVCPTQHQTKSLLQNGARNDAPHPPHQAG
jgi:hypothetical protein